MRVLALSLGNAHNVSCKVKRRSTTYQSHALCSNFVTPASFPNALPENPPTSANFTEALSQVGSIWWNITRRCKYTALCTTAMHLRCQSYACVGNRDLLRIVLRFVAPPEDAQAPPPH